MGKKDKNKKKGKGAEKTAMKTDKKLAAKQKKMLEKLGEADINEVVQKMESEQERLATITEEVCAPPSPRSYFSLVAHPEKEELIMFGGELFNGSNTTVYNDLYFYNIKKNEWKQLRSPAGPAPRSAHQMVTTATDGGQLWIFGGEHASPTQSQFYHYKDLWLMHLKTRKWEKINAANGPSARSGHRMIAAKKKLFVFGGFHDNNQTYQYYNDVHIFSLETYSWLKTEIMGVVMPAPRSGGCIAATNDGKILIWGGYSRSPCKKDLDKGITHTDMFALMPDKNDENKYKWSSIKPGGYRPMPRSCMAFANALNAKSYCFGGVTDSNENEEDLNSFFSDELLALDLNALTWRLLEINDKTKIPKKGKSQTSINDVEMEAPGEELGAKETVTTDGIFTITVAGASNSSTSLATKPGIGMNPRAKNGPTPRMKAGMCVCKGVLYIFGGIYEGDERQMTLNDFYALDLHKLNAWKEIIPFDTNAHDWHDSDTSESETDEESSSDDDDDDDSDDGLESEPDPMDTD